MYGTAVLPISWENAHGLMSAAHQTGPEDGFYGRQQWDGPAVLRPRQQAKLARGVKDEEHAMSHKLNSGIAVIGIDIGKKLVSRGGAR